MRPAKTVVGIGELLWDCFVDTRRIGGAPANVAFHAAALGNVGLVCSRVGYDALGNELVATLEARGLDCAHVQRDRTRPTGTVLVDTAQPERPAYTIHADVAWDHLEFNASLERLAGQADAVCFGTLAQRSAASRDAIRALLRAAHGARRVYDVNLRQEAAPLDTIEASLRLAHVVKVNEEEASALSRVLRLPAERAAFARALCERFEVELVCVTRGPRGCEVYWGSSALECPGRAVEVVDTVGAGDAFTAGLVSGLLWGWPPARAAALANELGALVAGAAGALPDLGRQVRDRVARYDQNGAGARP